MGKLKEFNILLLNNREVFYPGEQLSGCVVIDLYKPMEMRGIRIEMQGKGYCSWSEEEGSDDDKRTVYYSGSETLFEYVSCLFGNMPQMTSNKISHPAGRYEYQFTFTLPPVLPSSFEGFHGHIRYELKAQIDKPWKFDHKFKRAVIINELIDTNQPNYTTGPGSNAHKEVGCLCCAAGPLDITAHIDRAAYCPGEAILITAEVQNHTTRDMETLKGKLVKEIIYHASARTKSDQTTVAKISGATSVCCCLDTSCVSDMTCASRPAASVSDSNSGPPIPKQEFANWDNQPFGIPATCPSIWSSKVISVQYYLQIEVAVPWGVDLKVKLPVVLGTVPFRGTYGHPPPHFQQPSEAPSFVPSTFAPPPTGLLGYSDMAPPSYAAAVGQTETNISGGDDQHTYGKLSYLPVYTYAQPYQPPPGASNQYHPEKSAQQTQPDMEKQPFQPPYTDFAQGAVPYSNQPGAVPYPNQPGAAPYPPSQPGAAPYPPNQPGAAPYLPNQAEAVPYLSNQQSVPPYHLSQPGSSHHPQPTEPSAPSE